GMTVRFTPKLMTHGGYQQEKNQQYGRDTTIAAMAVLFSVLTGFIVLLTGKKVGFAFLLYIGLMFPLLLTQDTMIEQGNNTLIVFLPLIIYGLIGLKLLLSGLIGLNRDQLLLRRLTYVGFALMLGAGLYLSLITEAPTAIAD